MVAAAYSRDEDALRFGLAGLVPSMRAPLAAAVADRLAELAREDGHWHTWAWALHLLTPEWHAEAGRELWKRLERWATPQAEVRTDSRRELARLAMRLVRGGVPGREALRRLDEANATLAAPLSSDAVGDLVIWAARAAGGRHVNA
jgi:hypothetical protein